MKLLENKTWVVRRKCTLPALLGRTGNVLLVGGNVLLVGGNGSSTTNVLQLGHARINRQLLPLAHVKVQFSLQDTVPKLILASVLNALYDAVSQMLKKNVEKRFLMDHLDAIYLAIDELVDGGVILEADSNSIVQRVAMKMDVEVPLSEQTVAQVIQTAKDQLKWSLLK
eukprot:gene19375-21298_t